MFDGSHKGNCLGLVIFFGRLLFFIQFLYWIQKISFYLCELVGGIFQGIVPFSVSCQIYDHNVVYTRVSYCP